MRRRLERFYSNPGERIKQNYTATQLQDGVIRLIPSDTTDIQEFIDSFAESCSIEHILALCSAGDTSVLSRAQGAYIDTTMMPKTFRDMLDIVIDGKSKFESLPIEIKNAFGNDFEAWFSDAGSDEWIKKMGLSEAAAAAAEVKESGSSAES